MPLRGPTCKIARFQAGLKFPSWTECGKSKKVTSEVEKTVVKVKDTVEFAATIMAARGLLAEGSVVPIGIDDGQGAI